MALTDRLTLAATLNLGLAPAWFRGLPRGDKPAPPDIKIQTGSLTALADITADAATDLLTTASAHGMIAGNRVQFTNASGALPAGLAALTTYYVSNDSLTDVDFKVSATENGAPVNITGAGTGTHTLNAFRNLSDVDLAAVVDWLAKNNPENFNPVTMALGGASIQVGNVDASTIALTKIQELVAYYNSSEYLNWLDDTRISREMLFRLRCADALAAVATAGTLPVSGDPDGAGGNPITDIPPLAT